MANKLYVGNLSNDVDSAVLQSLFSQYGTVLGAQVIADRITGQSKGFGFVQMGTDAEAQGAVVSLHGSHFHGQTLSVSVAQSRTDQSGGRTNW